MRSSRATHQFRHTRPIGGLVVVWFGLSIASAPNVHVVRDMSSAVHDSFVRLYHCVCILHPILLLLQFKFLRSVSLVFEEVPHLRVVVACHSAFSHRFF